MVLSIQQKKVRKIPGDPVQGVAVQSPVDGLDTGTPLYSVAVQGTMVVPNLQPLVDQVVRVFINTTTGVAIYRTSVPVPSPANNHTGSVVARDKRGRIAALGTRSYNTKFVIKSQRSKMKMKFSWNLESEVEVCQIQRTLKALSKKDVKIIVGNWNVKIGSDNIGFKKVMEKYGAGNRNDKWERSKFSAIKNANAGRTQYKLSEEKTTTTKPRFERSEVRLAEFYGRTETTVPMPKCLKNGINTTSHIPFFYIYKTRLKIIQTSIKIAGFKFWTELVPSHLRAITNLQQF
ncbi:hypothetical protein HELRODRAFT_178594 [Helobdella robusta]|uniref:Endonuclease/exonuclease/phosphatase domain-containing protein n=1 Tax=Helobdella robusta TaxID=6412 RepID=T1FDF7_HELRO|nr:hypothetical protein HELRODRAFT_178594 [Helobdella robusta]ESN96805.1 hypothetical protein HELRODRAFT_178594 [Helobdella robusta]